MSARARLRPCLDCRRPTRNGSRCARCTVDRGYSASHWQHVRTARLELDGHRCQLRHPGCTGRARTVHLHPDCRGYHNLATIGNTVSACAHCHGAEDGPRASGRPATSDASNAARTTVPGAGVGGEGPPRTEPSASRTPAPFAQNVRLLRNVPREQAAEAAQTGGAAPAPEPA